MKPVDVDGPRLSRACRPPADRARCPSVAARLRAGLTCALLWIGSLLPLIVPAGSLEAQTGEREIRSAGVVFVAHAGGGPFWLDGAPGYTAFMAGLQAEWAGSGRIRRTLGTGFWVGSQGCLLEASCSTWDGWSLEGGVDYRVVTVYGISSFVGGGGGIVNLEHQNAFVEVRSGIDVGVSRRIGVRTGVRYRWVPAEAARAVVFSAGVRVSVAPGRGA